MTTDNLRIDSAEIPVIAPDEPFPGRKIVRGWLIPLCSKGTLLPLLLLVFDFALFFGAIAATVLLTPVWAKIGVGLVAGFIIGRLFILGHDACHQSFTPHRGLNRVLGRIAFLPSLTPYSLWDIGHNLVHHGQTNLKGFDFGWAAVVLGRIPGPFALAPVLEPLLRSGWAP